jgi:SH3-like domain-containing protein
MDSPVQIGRVSQIDPAPLRYSLDPIFVVRGDGYRANVRQSPNTTARILVSVPAGTIFAAIGRTDDGNWLRVQNAAYEGWISRQVLYAENGNFEALPVTE